MNRWLAALAVLVLGRRRRRARIGGRERVVQPGFPDRQAESLVVVLFLCWNAGMFDTWLVHAHLNRHDCVMNGFGAFPLPSAICFIVRPDATD